MTSVAQTVAPSLRMRVRSRDNALSGCGHQGNLPASPPIIVFTFWRCPSLYFLPSAQSNGWMNSNNPEEVHASIDRYHEERAEHVFMPYRIQTPPEQEAGATFSLRAFDLPANRVMSASWDSFLTSRCRADRSTPQKAF